jgi:hypothetical protein
MFNHEGTTHKETWGRRSMSRSNVETLMPLLPSSSFVSALCAFFGAGKLRVNDAVSAGVHAKHVRMLTARGDAAANREDAVGER